MAYSLNKTKFLNDKELQYIESRIAGYLNNPRSKDYRDALLISLSLRTGGRAQEILNIRKSDLNSQDSSVFIKGLKNSNDREIPLEESFFQKINAFAQNMKEDEQIFKISYIRFYQIWKNYSPCNKGIHSLRHTFALNLYKKTKDIRLVQCALGHKSINNTMVYASYVYTTNELRKAINLPMGA